MKEPKTNLRSIARDYDISKIVAVHRGLDLALAKLYMLKNSSEAIYKAEEFRPGRVWFKGTAIIYQDIIDHVEIALSFLEEISSSQEKESTADDSDQRED